MADTKRIEEHQAVMGKTCTMTFSKWLRTRHVNMRNIRRPKLTRRRKERRNIYDIRGNRGKKKLTYKKILRRRQRE